MGRTGRVAVPSPGWRADASQLAPWSSGYELPRARHGQSVCCRQRGLPNFGPRQSNYESAFPDTSARRSPREGAGRMSMLSRRSLLSALLALSGIAVVPNRANGAAKAMVVDDVKSWLAGEALPVGLRYLQLQSAEANLDVLVDL